MTRKKIGDLLIERGFITREQLEQALQQQAASGKRVGTILVEIGAVTEEQLIDTMAEKLSIPRVSLDAMVIDPSVIQRVPVEIARRHTLVPIFGIGNTLTVAMADPLNFLALDEIKYHTGSDIKRAVATISEIKAAIDEYYSVADSLQGIVGKSELNEIEELSADEDVDEDSDIPIVKLVNLIISKAVKDSASDIHIEPDSANLRIRYRVNGAMREEASPPKSMQNELISRIKIASDMDVSEKRLPQDGRFMMRVDARPIDLRVSTLPTIHGEKIVIRILDPKNVRLKFEELGFRESLKESWQTLINKPEGLILICGPTSSGKTSTLYATLQDINSIEKNIITVEDPVEYSLPLINQIQINEKAGLSFPSTLRSILRQNPDIIMIGEIRDSETAQMAIRSSLTGHLVFSTIHTNDAPSAITRLADMGVEKYLVTAALKGILSQRLVRVNCPNCSEVYEPPAQVIKRAGMHDVTEVIQFKRGSGCSQCKNTGFKGLTGLFEYLEITPEIVEMVLRDAPLNSIRDVARRNGYLPLFEAGLELVTRGVVSLEELLKETTNIEDYAFGLGNIIRTPADATAV